MPDQLTVWIVVRNDGTVFYSSARDSKEECAWFFCSSFGIAKREFDAWYKVVKLTGEMPGDGEE